MSRPQETLPRSLGLLLAWLLALSHGQNWTESCLSPVADPTSFFGHSSGTSPLLLARTRTSVSIECVAECCINSDGYCNVVTFRPLSTNSNSSSTLGPDADQGDNCAFYHCSNMSDCRFAVNGAIEDPGILIFAKTEEAANTSIVELTKISSPPPQDKGLTTPTTTVTNSSPSPTSAGLTNGFFTTTAAAAIKNENYDHSLTAVSSETISTAFSAVNVEADVTTQQSITTQTALLVEKQNLTETVSEWTTTSQSTTSSPQSRTLAASSGKPIPIVTEAISASTEAVSSTEKADFVTQMSMQVTPHDQITLVLDTNTSTANTTAQGFGSESVESDAEWQGVLGGNSTAGGGPTQAPGVMLGLSTTEMAVLASALALGCVLFLVAAAVVGRRLQDGWRRRQYNRIEKDYLVDGMYHE